MTSMVSNRSASTLWIMLLTLVSTVATLALACATPYAALAALAATRMRLRDGVLLMAAAWGASQAVGFCVLGYPHRTSTFLWGAVLGLAAIAGVVAARFAAQRIPARHGAVTLAIALVVATIAIKAVVLMGALNLGGVAITLSPSLTFQSFVRNAAFLIGLVGVYRLARRVGMPAPALRAASV